jgi:hypothetical protein
MNSYRLYYISNHHIEDFAELACQSDAVAIEEADALVCKRSYSDYELWHHDRVVYRSPIAVPS